jgi:LysR family hydrogen peroxide-inducible transcriptional activator
MTFNGEAPHRRIAMVWRRSSAMDDFLHKLADEFRRLPEALLQPPAAQQGSTILS